MFLVFVVRILSNCTYMIHVAYNSTQYNGYKTAQ
jgi:hypothetical protein